MTSPDTIFLTEPGGLPPPDRERIGRLPAEERLAAVRADQSGRWRGDRPLTAEAYLDAFPELFADPADALVVIGGEIALMQERGGRPDQNDLVRRFPRFAAELPLLVATQQALWGAEKPAAGRPIIDGYDILSELGHGATGIVYRAVQTSLDRPVALKVLLRGGLAGSSAVARFQSEALASARLHHPSIVQVYDVGEALTPSGVKVPFIALELIDGPTLDAWCRDRIIAPRDAAGLIRQLADAMEAAHRVGVVHRDLKPANVLLASGTSDGPGSESQPGPSLAPLAKITDFGLAKLLDGSGEQTATGTILGTPAYMAPEQAGAKRDAVGPGADIYSLGAILYQLVTGLPPFRGDGVAEVIHQVLNVEPVPPARLRAGLPRDLETLCLKCLEKEPGRRYPSASSLAEDLRRFLDGRPVLARPLGPTGVAWRWCRRYPAVSGLAAAVTALVVTVAVVASAAAVRLSSALAATQQAERQTSVQLLESLIAQADANRMSRRPGQRFETLRLLGEARRLADAIGDGGAHDHTIRDLAAAALSLPDIAPGPKWPGRLPDSTVLADADPDWTVYARTHRDGSWTVRRLDDDHELAAGPPTPGPSHAAPYLSPDGRLLALRYSDRAEVWSVAEQPPRRLTQVPFGYAIQFRPDARVFVASQSGGRVRVYALPSAEPVAEFQAAATREVAVAVHPTEPLVATCSYYSRTVVVYDWRSGAERWRATMPSSSYAAAWSPDGRWLAVSGEAAAGITLFAAHSPVPVRRIATEMGGLRLAFLPGSDRLAGWDWNAKWTVWDAATGRQLAQLTGAVLNNDLSPHSSGRLLGPVRDGGDLAAYRVADGRECRVLAARPNVMSLAVCPRGRLAAAGTDNGVLLWDLATGQSLPTLGAGHILADAQFTADGSLLATGGSGSFRWPAVMTPDGDSMTLGPPGLFCEARANSLAVSADGALRSAASRAISTFQPDAGLWLWRTGGPARGRRLEAGRDSFSCRLSSDGRWLAAYAIGSTEGAIFDARSGGRVPVARAEGRTFPYRSLDGLRSFDPGNSLRVKEPAEPADAAPAPSDRRAWTHSPVFSPDGRLVAYSGPGVPVRLDDAATGREVIRLETLEPLRTAAFSPDGRRLLAIGAQSVIIWDLGLLFQRLRELGFDRGDPPLPEIQPAESLGMHRTLRVVTPGAWRLTTDAADLADLPRLYLDQSPEGLRRSGQVLKRLGSHAEATARFTALHRHNPADAEANYELGLDALNRQDRPAADRFLTAAAADPQLKDVAELLRAAMARRCGPGADLPRTLTAEGFYFFERDDLGAAVSCLEEAVRLDPAHSLALRLLSRLRAAGPAPWRSPEKALALARRAAAADPSFGLPRTTIGIALLRMNRTAEARAALAEAELIGESSLQGFNWYYLAIAAAAAGDHSAAASYWDRAETWWQATDSPRYGLPRCLRRELEAARNEARP